MRQLDTEIRTDVDVQQKIALSFMIGTAALVLIATIAAATATYLVRPSLAPLPGDRSFNTTR